MSHQNPTMMASVTSFSPDPEEKDQPDTMPSDYQPPGTDEDDDMPQSLEEALLGE